MKLAERLLVSARPIPRVPAVAALGTTMGHLQRDGGINIPVPAGVAAGTVINVCIFFESTSVTVSAPDADWVSTVITNSFIGYRQLVFRKRASGADSGTYNFTWTGNIWCNGFAVSITGCPLTGAFRETGFTITGNTNVAVPLLGTIVNRPSELLMYIATTNQEGGVWTPPAGFSTIKADGCVYMAAKPQMSAIGQIPQVQATTAVASYKAALLYGLLSADAPL